MKMFTKTQPNANRVFIMFADLKEYSANKDSLELILKMENVLYQIGDESFPENEHCFKVLGDGMLATDKNPVALAQKAISIIDKIKKTFENDADFKTKPQIRIALHLANEASLSERRTTYQIENQEFTIFKDIAGKDVINTARIEPVVKPNYVFCSKDFALELQTLKSMGFNPDVEVTTLDTYKLGKEHDSFEVELFVVFNKNNQPNADELKQHINQKLEKREETYQNASPLAASYINQGTQIMGDSFTNVKNVVKNVKGNVHIGGDKTYHQNAGTITNIGKIDKANL
jgi:hypothetical protein